MDVNLAQNIMERSDLYSLEPIGLGTPYVESLSSYICRLAEAHCLDVRIFTQRVIFPYIKGLTRRDYPGHNFYIQSIQTDKGRRWMTHEISTALETLTLQRDLTSLSMSKWRYVIGRKYLHKEHFAWCPRCLNEWRNNEFPIYQPLIWTISEVHYCPHHKIKLRSRCPNRKCGHVLSYIETKMKIGYCPKCYTWLGCGTEDNSEWIPKNNDFELWGMKAIEEWIVSTSQLKTPPENTSFEKLITSYVYSHSNESFRRLAKKIGISITSLNSLRERNRNITFPVALKACKYFKVPLSQILNENYEQRLIGKFTGEKKTKSIDKRLLEEQLRNILKENPPLSLNKTAKKLGHSTNTLSRYFPDLCSKIIKGYKDFALENDKIYMGDRLLNPAVRRKEIKRQIDKCLEFKTPLPLSKIEKEMGISVVTLKIHFPREHQELLHRYKNYRSKMKKYKSTVRDLTYGEIKEKLERIIASEDGLCLLMNDVIEQLGLNGKTVKRLFPDLCQTIVKHHKEYANMQAQLRREKTLSRIKKLMEEAYLNELIAVSDTSCHTTVQ